MKHLGIVRMPTLLANEDLVFENLTRNLDIDLKIVGHDQTLLGVKMEEPE
jgi:hypothetical protein